MNYGLTIRDSATLDFVCLGALVHRLDPGIIPFRKANQCQNDARIIERREDGTSVGLCVLCAQEQWKLAAAEAMKA